MTKTETRTTTAIASKTATVTRTQTHIRRFHSLPPITTINSQGHSGTSVVEPGTYTGVSVNADGNWTIKILPNK